MKKKYLFVLISLLSLLLVACSGNNTDTNNETNDNKNMENETGNESGNDQDQNDSENPQNLEGDPSVKGNMSPTDAYERYLEEYPNTKVAKVQLDEDNGSFKYEIEGFDDQSEYKLEINSSNGEVLEAKSEKDKDKQTEIPKDLLNNVQALVDEALKDAGESAYLDGWEVEFDNQKFVLEVSVEKENGEDADYKYNLETKELITIDS